MSSVAHGKGELAWCYMVRPGAANSLDEQALRALQLERLNRSLKWACDNSPFYQAHLPVQKLASLKELQLLPLMDATTLSTGFE